MAKKIYHYLSFNHRFLKGLNLAADTIVVTAGPLGRNVLIEQSHDLTPLILNDGVSIAKAISLTDNVANLGASIIKHAAIATNCEVGDGTTTAVILTQAIVNQAFQLIDQKINPVLLKNQLELWKNLINIELNKLVMPVTDNQAITAVATIAANNSKIGKIIAQAFNAVGKNGIINVDNSLTTESSLVVSEGFEFNGGYLSNYFINESHKLRIVHHDVKVLVCDFLIQSLHFLLSLLEKAKQTKQVICLVAKDFSSEAIGALSLNQLKKVLTVIPIKPTNYFQNTTDLLHDLAVFCNSKILYNEQSQLPEWNNWASVDQLIIDKKQTTIVSTNNQEQKKAWIKILQTQAQNFTNTADQQQIEKRIAQLNGQVAILKIAGETEIEQQERKYRVEDALNATKHAIHNGVVPGAGAALVYAQQQLIANNQLIENNLNDLIPMTSEISLAPLKQILINAGFDSDQIGLILTNLQSNDQPKQTVDVFTKKIVNAWDVGVVDPLKVVLTAFNKAISVACTLITTASVIVEAKEKQRFVFRDLK